MKTENFFYKNKKDFTGTLEERDALLQHSISRLKTKKQVKNIEHKTLYDYLGDTFKCNKSWRKAHIKKIVNANTAHIGALVTFEDDSKKFYFWNCWGEGGDKGHYYYLSKSAGEKYIKEVLDCWVYGEFIYGDISTVAGKPYTELTQGEYGEILFNTLNTYFKERSL
jgi:hypothetical protein